MAKKFDKEFWQDALGKPDWYLRIANDFKRIEKFAEYGEEQAYYEYVKHSIYAMVEMAVGSGQMPLGSSGDNLDKDRLPIDTIVIHHTKNQPGMTLERLNAMHLLRIYGMYYADPTDPRELHLRGKSTWSGHFYNGRQIFWGYHWFIRNDKDAEQILDNNYIGWHAGNWDINKRSIGICIDDDLSKKEASDAAINRTAEVITTYYPHVAKERIVGHCDVNKKTECPGHLFHEKWQKRLLSQL